MRSSRVGLLVLLLWTSLAWGGVVCDGTDDFVTLNNTESNYDFANASFTVAFWGRTTTSVTRRFVAKTDAGPTGGWATSGTTAGYASSIYNSGGGAAGTDTGTTVINGGAWFHFATVFTTDTTTSANNVVTLYVNGVAETTSLTHTGVYAGNALSVSLCRQATTYLNGSIDDLRIYSGALSAGNIANLYQSKQRGNRMMGPGALVSYVPMDECADGAAVNGVNFKDVGAGSTATADDGANNTGMTCTTTGVVLRRGMGIE